VILELKMYADEWPEVVTMVQKSRYLAINQCDEHGGRINVIRV
jgi:hypothetical protein